MNCFLRSFSLLFFISIFNSCQTNSVATEKEEAHPRLIVFIIADQMRAEMLNRYENDFGENGFNRISKNGFLFDSCNYNYIPTYTGPGHATIFTGLYPKNHGITANDWYDTNLRRTVYCVSDDSVNGLGSDSKSLQRSPKNLKGSNLTSILKSQAILEKSIHLSLKDRSAILPGGKDADIVLWMDEKGNFVSSDYYMKDLPNWVKEYNEKDRCSFYLNQQWHTIYPKEKYRNSFPDNHPFESRKLGDPPVLPYDLKQGEINHGREIIKSTPFGNTMLRELAEKAISIEGLGQNDKMDLISISFSSTDYIGHDYGPNSVEIHDTYIRLDNELDSLFSFLDESIGNDYLVILTSDHGVADLPDTNSSKPYTSSFFIDSSLYSFSQLKWNSNLIMYRGNQQIYLDRAKIGNEGLDPIEVENEIINYLKSFDEFESVWSLNQTGNDPYQVLFKNGGYTGDIGYQLREGLMTRDYGTTHGTGYKYDTHVPCIFYGKEIPSGNFNRNTHVVDIVPTLLGHLGLQGQKLDGDDLSSNFESDSN